MKITALMPLKHYHLPYLKKAISSVKNQTIPNWLLLVIVEKEDHSVFVEILKEEVKDQRIRIIINEGRKLAGAVNTGMRHALSDFTALLFSDDLWSKDAVEVLCRAVKENPDVDFFHSSRMVVDENDNPVSSIHPSREAFTMDDFRSGSPVKHLLCWRKDMALSFGGVDESLNSVGPDDYDFPWTMAEHGAKFKAIKECLYLYRDHRDCFRLTTHLPLSTHKRETKRILKKHGVDAWSIRKYVAVARNSYLRQCLYKTALDKWIKDKLGYDARQGWREKFR